MKLQFSIRSMLVVAAHCALLCMFLHLRSAVADARHSANSKARQFGFLEIPDVRLLCACNMGPVPCHQFRVFAGSRAKLGVELQSGERKVLLDILRGEYVLTIQVDNQPPKQAARLVAKLYQDGRLVEAETLEMPETHVNWTSCDGGSASRCSDGVPIDLLTVQDSTGRKASVLLYCE